MNAKILIIEGTSGVGKSCLAEALVRKYIEENKKLRSLLYRTQAHTYGPLAVDEDSGTLTIEANKKHLERVYTTLEWHMSSVARERKAKFFCIMGTLHIAFGPEFLSGKMFRYLMSSWRKWNAGSFLLEQSQRQYGKGA